MSDVATSQPPQPEPVGLDDDGRPPTVVVDDVHVTYRVFAGGRRVNEQRNLLRRRLSTQRVREVRALRGVTLVAREGDAIGLVGRNGSGKSTLLRTIAGLLTPTAGSVYAEGDPALLGVNAALINELSGERNVILGGLAIGLSPRQIRDRYSDIVAFSGVGDAIDLPMRTYSSGMSARLRFAIASATTQGVLLIDEALATGDAQFRKRSERRIDELREHAGTVFLVSHSLSEVKRACSRCIWLDQGRVRMDGDVEPVLEAYREWVGSGS